MTVDFVQSLPHLDKQTCTEILQLLDTPSREERRNMPGNYQLILVSNIPSEATQMSRMNKQLN